MYSNHHFQIVDAILAFYLVQLCLFTSHFTSHLTSLGELQRVVHDNDDNK
jgi:hypothetical protein